MSFKALEGGEVASAQTGRIVLARVIKVKCSGGRNGQRIVQTGPVTPYRYNTEYSRLQRECMLSCRYIG